MSQQIQENNLEKREFQPFWFIAAVFAIGLSLPVAYKIYQHNLAELGKTEAALKTMNASKESNEREMRTLDERMKEEEKRKAESDKKRLEHSAKIYEEGKREQGQDLIVPSKELEDTFEKYQKAHKKWMGNREGDRVEYE